MAQRAHPGHRRRRRRTAAVPLPRPVAGPAGRGEARAGAARSPASCPTSATPSRPALRTRGLNRDRVLATAIRLLDLGAFRIGSEQYEEENGTYGLATLKRDARLGPRRADVLLLHRQGRHRARGRDHRPADGDRRPAAAGAAGGRRGGPAGLPDRGRRVAGRDQRRDQRLPQGDQRRGDHRQGLPHLDGDGADGGRARRGAAADEPDGAQEGRSAPPTSRSASSSATPRRCARPATSTRGWSTGSRTARRWPHALRRGRRGRGRPGRPAGARGRPSASCCSA